MQISTHTYTKRTALFIFATISLQTFCDTPSPSSTPNIFNTTSILNHFIANNPSAAARFLITPQPIHTATSIPNVGFFSSTSTVVAAEQVYLSHIIAIGAASVAIGTVGLGSSAAASAAAATGSSAGLGASASIGVGAAAGAAGAIVAVGAGGYYWYRRHQLKKIDYTPNYDPQFGRVRFPV